MLQIQNLGVGTDIENIGRFKKFISDKNNPFLNHIFTKNELEFCFSKEVVANHLAARFAGKEASIKALCSLGRENFNYKDIEILSDSGGVPRVRINNKNSDKLQVYLSLSHCKDKALAFVIVAELSNNEKN